MALLNSPLQWVFNKSLILGSHGDGQYICASISGAWEHIHQSKKALQDVLLEAISQAFPRAAEAIVERILIVKQEHATFRSIPGSARCRPPAETPLENLFLAGEWTDTGWPATMEGAVRSGLRAAEAAMGRGDKC